MGKLNINNGGVDTNKKMADIDERFGPYTSIEAADAALGGTGRNTITAGLTVGILTANGGVKEYWYQPNKKTGQLELIPKGGNAVDNPTDGNFASFDANGNVVDSGFNEDSFAPTEQAVPMGDTEDVGKILEKQANGFGWVDKPVDGKSALDIYNELNPEAQLDEAGFIAKLQQKYPMKHAAYYSGSATQTVGTPFTGALDNDGLLPTSDTMGNLYIMPNSGTTPTGSIAFTTINTGENQYAWVNLGAVDIPDNALTEDDVDDTHLTNPVADSLAKATDAMQLKKKLINLPNELVNPSLNVIDLQNEYSGGYIMGTSSPYKWWTGGTRKCVLVMTTNGSIRITANESQRTHYAFLTSIPEPNNGDTVDNLVDGTGLYFIDQNTTEEIQIPDGANYIYIKIAEGVNNYAPSSVVLLSDRFLVEKDIVDGLDSNETKKALSAKQGKNLNSKIIDITAALNPFVDYKLDNTDFIYWRIKSSNGSYTWHANGFNCQCYLLDVKPGEKFKLTKDTGKPGSDTTYCQWVFLANKPEYSEITEGLLPDFANDTPNSQYINQNSTAATEAEFEIPDGCYCLYISKSVNRKYPTGTAPSSIRKQPLIEDVDLTRPSTVFIEKSEQLRYSALGLRPINFQVNEDGWELPQTLQQLNVIKKSNQLRFLKWTPKHNIPANFDSSHTNLDTIPQGVVFQHGIPYSSNWQDYKYVGMQVSIYTFLTAINNPYSLMYTECVSKKSGWGKSAWGRKWINTNGTSYYGLVCCGFTGVVTNCPVVWNNPDFAKLSEDGKEFVKVAPKGVFIPELVQIGDIFDSDSHSYAVYSIQRDSDGNFIQMRISESTRGIEGSAGCQFRDLETPVNLSTYTHYRYMPLCNNWKFTEEDTDFAEMNQILPDNAQVTQPSQSYNNDICTFAGDKACFSVGAINDLIVLNYNLQNGELMYDRILLYKDNEQTPVVLMLSDADDSLTGIYDAANSYNNNISQIGHAYVVSNPRSGDDSDVLAAGKYHAVLSDANDTKSNPTYFEVLENPISFVPSDSYVEVKYTNPISACSLGIIEANDGDPVFMSKISHPLSFAEIDSMTIKIDRHDLIDYPINSLYLRLMTVGEYGVSQVIEKLVADESDDAK